MGVFNTEPEEAKYTLNFCLTCIHYGKPDKGQECPVMLLHALYMDRRSTNIEIRTILDTLIPISNNNNNNQQCKMYRGKNEKIHQRNEECSI